MNNNTYRKVLDDNQEVLNGSKMAPLLYLVFTKLTSIGDRVQDSYEEQEF